MPGSLELIARAPTGPTGAGAGAPAAGEAPAGQVPAVGGKARAAVGDVAIGALIFLLGVWLGARAVQEFRADGGRQLFYQSEFGPAVMMACGRGLQNPDARNAGALEAFLSERVDAMGCADLPAAIPVTALDPFQRASRYLELAVALVWRVRGVSWSRLAILPALLFGAVATLTYGLFRLALSRTLALLGMVPTFMSTSNLTLVPHIRDYAKGPFLLAVMFMMGILVAGPTDRRRAIGVSALAGAVVGLGLGFRTDLMIALPPFLLTLAFLVAVSIATRIGAVAVFLGAFALVAFPMLHDYASGNNIGPVVLLGLTTPFDRPLGIQPSVYEFGGQYNDSLVFSIVNSYVIRVEQKNRVEYATAEHGRAAMAYVGGIAGVFPADMVTRIVAATRAVPRYFLQSSLDPPSWIRSPVLLFLYRLRASVSLRLAFAGVAAVAAATILVGIENVRAGWLIVVMLFAFAGGSAIQFHERHFYYLQLLPWWAFGVLAQAGMRGSVLVRSGARPPGMQHVTPAILLCAAVIAGAGGSILLSRAYQRRTAARLFETYESAPRARLLPLQRPAGPGRTLIAAPEWLERLRAGAPWIQTQFLAVEFRDDLCGPGDLALTARYQATLPELDFSEPLVVRLHKDPPSATTLFLPAYDRPDDSSRFRGVEVVTEQARCVGPISRVEGIDRTPLLLTATLANGWRGDVLYQRLR